MIRTVLIALTLTLTPMSAFAQCDHDRAAASCADGFQWNADQGKCVPIVTG